MTIRHITFRHSEISPHYISLQAGQDGCDIDEMQYMMATKQFRCNTRWMQYRSKAGQDRTDAGQDRTDAGQDRYRTGQMQYMTALLCILIMTYFLNSSYKCRQPIIVKILSKEPGHLDLFSCRGRNIFNVFFNN